MILIEWSEEFTIGVPAIDREHREIVALVNRVYAQLADPDSDVTISDFLGELHARMAAHFETEEQLMRTRRYDQTEQHVAEHERLLDELREMMDQYEQAREYDETHLARRLGDWFTLHFKVHDSRLRDRLG